MNSETIRRRHPLTTPSKGSGDGSGDGDGDGYGYGYGGGYGGGYGYGDGGASRIWNAIMNPNSPESEREWAREQMK